jgi:hypothetical protein
MSHLSKGNWKLLLFINLSNLIIDEGNIKLAKVGVFWIIKGGWANVRRLYIGHFHII